MCVDSSIRRRPSSADDLLYRVSHEQRHSPARRGGSARRSTSQTFRNGATAPLASWSNRYSRDDLRRYYGRGGIRWTRRALLRPPTNRREQTHGSAGYTRGRCGVAGAPTSKLKPSVNIRQGVGFLLMTTPSTTLWPLSSPPCQTLR